MYGLKCWETYKGQLKELSTLLCYKFRLDLFVATCLNHNFNLLVLEARKLFSKSLPSLHEQRWGSVTSFITGMLIRLPMLQTFWNTSAFASCRSQATAGDEFDAAAIGAIITDPFFAAYSEMLQCDHLGGRLSVPLRGTQTRAFPQSTKTRRQCLASRAWIAVVSFGWTPGP